MGLQVNTKSQVKVIIVAGDALIELDFLYLTPALDKFLEPMKYLANLTEHYFLNLAPALNTILVYQ